MVNNSDNSDNSNNGNLQVSDKKIIASNESANNEIASNESAKKVGDTYSTKATKQFVFGDVGHCISFGFGAGLVPKMPGTAGTLLAFPLYYLALLLPLEYRWGLLVALFFLGVWLCGRAGKALQRHDDGGIVLDEIVAFYGVLLCTPPQWFWQLAAFAIFRILDSLKPPPINWLDKNISGGWGVMLDDLAAAIISVLLLAAFAKIMGMPFIF